VFRGPRALNKKKEFDATKIYAPYKEGGEKQAPQPDFPREKSGWGACFAYSLESSYRKVAALLYQLSF
jgi:hypothetical protein